MHAYVATRQMPLWRDGMADRSECSEALHLPIG